MNQNDPGYYTITAAAKYLSLSPQSVEQLIIKGSFPYYKPTITGKQNRRILIARADLDRWMAQYRIDPSENSSRSSREPGSLAAATQQATT